MNTLKMPVRKSRKSGFKTIVVGIVAVVMMMGSTIALHAGTLNFILEQRGGRIPQSVLLEGGEIFVKSAGGDQATDLLFEAAEDRLFVIDHRSKTYMKIDQKVINEVAALANTVSQAVGSQQSVLADLLSTFGIGEGDGVETVSARLADSGRTLSIGGFDCRLYQAIESNQLKAELCFAPADRLKLDSRERETLERFAAFGNNLVTRAGKLLELLGLQLPHISVAALPGLPIGMHAPAQQLKARLVGINQADRHRKFILPAGYTLRPIPFTSG